MTYRERRLAKADRLREWARNREQRATQQLNSQQELRRDWAFITQPGHIPERARMNARDDRAHESLAKAHSMESRADAIEAQADKAIYSDDEDAPERLRAKIAGLEAQRDHHKAVNVAIRKAQRARGGAPQDTVGAVLADLICSQVVSVEEADRLRRNFALQPYHGLGYPAYDLTNLGANIRRQKQRLEEIERQKIEGPPWKYCHAARYAGTCTSCTQPIELGAPIVYRRGTDEAQHFACYQAAEVSR